MKLCKPFSRSLYLLPFLLLCGVLYQVIASSRNVPTLTGVTTAMAESGAVPIAPRIYAAHKLCDLSDKEIDECSGLAASRRYPGYLWVHNDSGDSARLFLINLAGKTVAQVNLQDAENVDWEDIAIVGTGKNAWLYVGDIGDNNENRKHVVIYRLHEPTIDLRHSPVTITVPCERMKLTYPDGAHNAETLIAAPDGNLIVVTKTLGESAIFRTPQPFRADAKQQLVPVGKYQFGHTGWLTRLATGGDLSPDGKRLIICTYTEAYEWTLPRVNPWTMVWQTKPNIFVLPVMKQCEAICYSADGSRIYLSSEKVPTPLYELVAKSP
ncbi:MAG: hypothetical protein JO316_16550 [Abitibacteriaceae bacterium]|nr:hypothetical protein [Abditibacteriaceae bacterium]